MPTDNPHEQRARAEKAAKLARIIYREMLECVARLTDEDWKLLAKRADVNEPSDETRSMVASLLKVKTPAAINEDV